MAEETTGRRRSSPLSAEAILDAAEALLEDGRREFSLRELGEALGVHNTAFYRHFRNKNELLRAAADRVLVDVAYSADDVDDSFEAVAVLCVSLRETLLARPAAAHVLAQGPARQVNELRLTERLLGLLRQGGLTDQAAVDAYHALVEFSVGSSVIDQTMAACSEEEREESYRRWRADYLGLDEAEFPNLVTVAPAMYHDARDQFRYGLDLMIESLRRFADVAQS